LFSAFECALKRAGFVKQPKSKKEQDEYHRNKFIAQPDWKTFSNKHSNYFDPNKSQELKDAWDYFVHAPPRKQILKDNSLDWSEPYAYVDTENILVWLLNSVKTGSQQSLSRRQISIVDMEEPARNAELLHHSIVILNSCLLLNKDVNSSVLEILGEEAFFTS